MRSSRGFTLIELLVVIAIIGILSSVVLASLNTARQKGVEATVKSNFRNAISAAELVYDNAKPNSYTGVCAALASMLASVNAAGATAQCWTYDNTRWGVAAKNSDGSKNWSVSMAGVATWYPADTNATGGTGSVTMDWDTAVAACRTAGGRMPSFEELKALSLAYGSVTPPSFQATSYWSGTQHPTTSANAYRIYLSDGGINNFPKTNLYYVRCIR